MNILHIILLYVVVLLVLRYFDYGKHIVQATPEQFVVNTLPTFNQLEFNSDFLPSSIGIREMDIEKFHIMYPIKEYEEEPLKITYFGFDVTKKETAGNNYKIMIDLAKYTNVKRQPFREEVYGNKRQEFYGNLVYIRLDVQRGKHHGEILVYFNTRINNDQNIQNYTLYGAENNLLYGYNI